MTTYATAAQLAAKWRPLSVTESATAEAHLEEGSALLRRLVSGLDAAITAETVDVVLVRKVLTDAVLRVMRNPSGATSQTIGPEQATFSGLNAIAVVTFTESELGLVTPPVEGISAGGSVIGSVLLGRPSWAFESAQDDPRC